MAGVKDKSKIFQEKEKLTTFSEIFTDRVERKIFAFLSCSKALKRMIDKTLNIFNL